jgi:hypothetical protein
MKAILEIPQHLVPQGQEELWRAVRETLRTLAEEPAADTTQVSGGGRGYSGSHAQRLSINSASQPIGTTFYEEDRAVTYQVAGDGVNARHWRPIAGEMTGTLSPNTKPTLTTKDAGFIFRATDFNRRYRWSGSAWEDLDAGDPRGRIEAFDTNPGTGWAICDGSGVTRSTATGGTAAFTTPNLSGAYIKGAAVYSASVVAAALTGSTDSQGAHTHTTAATISGLSGTADVQSGAGANVAANSHTHAFSAPTDSQGAHTHGPGTLAADVTHVAIPYYTRL